MKDEPATSSPSSTPTNTKLVTMSQPDTPFASTKNQLRGKAGPVSHSPILRHRARSLSSGLPPRGLVASRVNTINMVSPLTDVVVSAHSDRDTLPSQTRPSSPTSTSHYRPSARTTPSSPLKRKCKIDDFALPPPPPTVSASANEAAQDDTVAASNLVTSTNKGVVQSEASNDESFTALEDSTAGSTPFHRGHRRNRTSLSQVVSRSEPLKGATYGTESFRATAGQYSHWPTDPHHTSSPDDYSGVDVCSCDASSDVRATKRKSLPGYSSTTSTMESGRSEEFQDCAPSPADETKEYERTPSIQSYTPSYDESSPGAGATSPAADEPYLPFRRVEKFNDTENFNSHTSPFSQYEYALSLSDMDTDDVRELYPLETLIQASAQDGCAIHDWASPWPSEQPVKKLLRFASRPDFAPSMHYESESDDYPSLQNLLDLDEHGPEPRRSPLGAVNVPDQAQDGGLATLAPVSYYPDVGSEMTILLPRTYNATSDDDETTLPSRTYDATASHELACLLPLTYDTNSTNALENASPIKRKPILRRNKDESLPFSAPLLESSNWVVHDGYDTEESTWTTSHSGVPTDTETSDLDHRDSLDDRDADIEKIHIEKRHERNGLKTTHEQTANSVGKFIEPCSNADVIKEPAPFGSITRRPLPTISHVLNPPLPTNTGVLNLDFQFPARNPQQQRGVSMPVFPPPSAARAQEKKNARRKSFRQFLGVAGNKEGGTETTTSGDKPKKSLGRRISQMGRRFSSIWSK